MYRIIGRVDDVINVSGHRFGTAEIENAINEHESVIESAVVGYPHEIKGQGIYAFVICENKVLDEIKMKSEIVATVSPIGSIAQRLLFVLIAVEGSSVDSVVTTVEGSGARRGGGGGGASLGEPGRAAAPASTLAALVEVVG